MDDQIELAKERQSILDKYIEASNTDDAATNELSEQLDEIDRKMKANQEYLDSYTPYEDQIVSSPFLDVRSNRLMDDDEIVEKVNSNVDNTVRTVRMYGAERSRIDNLTEGKLSSEGLAFLTNMAMSIFNSRERMESMYKNITYIMEDVASEVEDLLPHLEEELESQSGSVRDLTNNEIETLRTLIENVKNLFPRGNMEFAYKMMRRNEDVLKQTLDYLINNFNLDESAKEEFRQFSDFLKLGERKSKIEALLGNYIKNPLAVETKLKSDLDEVANSESKARTTSLEEKLRGVTNREEYNQALEDFNGTQEEFEEAQKRASSLNKSLDEIDKAEKIASRAANDIFNNDDITVEEQELIARSFNAALEKSSNAKEFRDRVSDEIPIEVRKIAKARNMSMEEAEKLLEKALDKANATIEKQMSDLSEAERLKPDDPVIDYGEPGELPNSGKDGNPTVESAPLKPNTEQNVPVISVQAIDNFDLYAPEEIDMNSPHDHYIRTTRELWKGTRHRWEFNAAVDAQPDYTEEYKKKVKAVHDYLIRNGAYDYINQGNLKVGKTKVVFVVDPALNKEAGVTVVLMAVKDKDGNYQVIGDLPVMGFAKDKRMMDKYPGLTAVYQTVSKEFKKAKTDKFFEGSLSTTVNQIYTGVLEADKDKPKKRVSDIFKGKELPAVGVIKRGTVEAEAISNSKIKRPLTMVEGGVVVLIPNAKKGSDGGYNIAYVELDSYDPSNTDPEGIDPWITDILTKLASAKNSNEIGSLLSLLGNFIYAPEFHVELAKADGKIAMRNGDSRYNVNKEDAVTVMKQLLQGSPMNFKIKARQLKFDGMSYEERMARHMRADLTVGTTTTIDNWFSVNPIENGIEKKGDKIPSTRTKPSQASTSLKVTIDNVSYTVNLDSNEVTDEKGNPVTDKHAKEVAIMEAWLFKNYGDAMNGSNMTDGVIKTRDGRFYDRKVHDFVEDPTKKKDKTEKPKIKELPSGSAKEDKKLSESEKKSIDRVHITITFNGFNNVNNGSALWSKAADLRSVSRLKAGDKVKRGDKEYGEVLYTFVDSDGNRSATYIRVTEPDNPIKSSIVIPISERTEDNITINLDRELDSTQIKEIIDFKNKYNGKDKLTEAIAEKLEEYDRNEVAIREKITQAESKSSFQTLEDIVKDLKDSSHMPVLTTDKKFYKKDGKKYARVTSVIPDERPGADNPFILPSTTIGNAVDAFTRDYFDHRFDKMTNDEVARLYPIFSKEQIKNLRLSLLDFSKTMVDAKGNPLHVIPKNVTVYGDIVMYDNDNKRKKIPVAGTVDLIAYDDEGNFYIYDMKTMRDSRSRDSEKYQAKWSHQLDLYRQLFELRYGKGKVKSLKIIPFNTPYAAPKGYVNQRTGQKGTAVYERVEYGNGIQDALSMNGNMLHFGATRLETLDLSSAETTFPRATYMDGDTLSLMYTPGKTSSSSISQELLLKGEEPLADDEVFIPPTKNPNDEDLEGAVPLGFKLGLNGSSVTKATEATPEVTSAANKLRDMRKLAEIEKSDEDDEAYRRADTSVAERWDEKKELEWLGKVLPSLSSDELIEIHNGLIKTTDGKYAYGRFKGSVITIADNAARGTLYHEAFHSVTHTLMDNAERNDMFNLAAKKWGKNHTRLELEELLAEDFREYTQDMEYASPFKRFFKKLWNMVRTLGGRRHTLNAIYYRVNQGKFARRQQMKSKISGETRLLSEMESIKNQAIANGTFMKAPNGRPTNLNERQWLQVRTQAFKNWFGDWENSPSDASKVVDENGEPLVVYHHRKDEITDFNKRKDNIFPGIYFSIKPYTWFGKYQIAAFLNLKNPIKESANITTEMSEDMYNFHIKKGYDGAIGILELEDLDPEEVHLAGEIREIIAFNSNQIKSATNNTGEFSTENDDIRYMEADVSDPSYRNEIMRESLTSFFQKFGITLQEVKNYKGSEPLFNALDRIIYYKNVKDLTEGCGYAIAYMLQYNPVVKAMIKKSYEQTPVDLKSLRRGIKTGNASLFSSKISDKAYAELDKDDKLKVIGSIIAEQLRLLYSGKETESVRTPFMEDIWKTIDTFFDKLSPSLRTEYSVLTSFASQIAYSVKLGDTSLIKFNDKKPGTDKAAVRMDVGRALLENPKDEHIISIMTKHGIALAGSPSVAAMGVVMRPVDETFHDLDFAAVGFTKEQIESILNKEFGQFEKTNEIDNGEDNVTYSYMVIDRPFTSEQIPGLSEWIIRDKKTGKVIGTRIGKTKLEMVNGAHGQILDFFTGKSGNPYPSIMTSYNGKQYLISDWRNFMMFKVKKIRMKDLFDFNRYVPEAMENLNEQDRLIKAQKDAEVLRDARIIWAHPAIGKTTYLNENDDIIEWDDRVNEKRDAFIYKQISPDGSMDINSQEYKTLKRKYMGEDWRSHPEYIDFLIREWNSLVEEAKRDNKRLFASPNPLLELFADQFDAVVTLPYNKFLPRNMSRGGTYASTVEWKRVLDANLQRIDSEKLIYTDKYFSDFMEGVKVLDEGSYSTIEQYYSEKTLYNNLSEKDKDLVEDMDFTIEEWNALPQEIREQKLVCRH